MILELRKNISTLHFENKEFLYLNKGPNGLMKDLEIFLVVPIGCLKN